jgi:arabinofuranan 3-O-arabinosyltransferase
VPAVADGGELGHRESVDVQLPSAVTGSRLQVEVIEVRETVTTDWYSEGPITMPIGIAELGVVLGPAASSIATDCRRDLLTIDGEPVGVTLLGFAVAPERREALDLVLCAGPLELEGGEHELRATPGFESGFDIDRLVLTSGPEGEAVEPPNPGATPKVADGATVEVIEQGPSSVKVVVDSEDPVWLVLGQSQSPGWRASDGLGGSTLVDGYANGWLVPGGSEPNEITLTFMPQRAVNAALLLSLLGALVCVGLLLFGKRDVALVDGADAEPEPEWLPPWIAVGSRPSTVVVVLVAVAGGVVAGLLVHPLTGVGVGVALAVGLVLSRGPGLLAGAALVSLGLSAAFTLAKQWRNHYPPDFGWPGFFRPAHHLAWIALLLLVASVVAAAVRRRSSPAATEPVEEPTPVEGST